MRLSLLLVGLTALSVFSSSSASANPTIGKWLNSVDDILGSYADAFEVGFVTVLYSTMHY
jgi:hypothetical protein